MKKAGFLLAAIYLLSPAFASAQQIPAGFTVQEGTSGKNQILADFDGDGQKDMLSIIEGNDHTQVYVAMKRGTLVLKSKDEGECCNSVKTEKSVVVLHSKGMRGFSTWRFRYDAALKNFRLIGWDTESFGNATGDGSGTSSLNLITGAFEAKYNSWNERKKKLTALPPVQKKLKVNRRILLTDFGDDSDNWLSDLTHKELPKAVQ